ncbi:hypothetical protein EYF80_053608 [Liparis tanakae]|uniref:Uncharacterized protein n=1 Tax=Liparis tanakae TaxID=230148 RepID=A0A4Z2F652_9TELE|nr:hypothetical protein EYF80_053608 [Liparis tanakae]
MQETVDGGGRCFRPSPQRHAGLPSQHRRGSVQRGPGEGGAPSAPCQLVSRRRPPAASLYELSRASRTFMICCLMTFVASPALGIRYLGGGSHVMSSGCFFLDVIFTTEFSACLDWM